GIIATVDAVNGGEQLTRHAEAVKQAAVADRLVLTKADLAAADAFAALSRRLQAINPAAQFFSSANAPPPARRLLCRPTAAAARARRLPQGARPGGGAPGGGGGGPGAGRGGGRAACAGPCGGRAGGGGGGEQGPGARPPQAPRGGWARAGAACSPRRCTSS